MQDYIYTQNTLTHSYVGQTQIIPTIIYCIEGDYEFNRNYFVLSKSSFFM